MPQQEQINPKEEMIIKNEIIGVLEKNKNVVAVEQVKVLD